MAANYVFVHDCLVTGEPYVRLLYTMLDLFPKPIGLGMPVFDDQTYVDNGRFCDNAVYTHGHGTLRCTRRRSHTGMCAIGSGDTRVALYVWDRALPDRIQGPYIAPRRRNP